MDEHEKQIAREAASGARVVVKFRSGEEYSFKLTYRGYNTRSVTEQLRDRLTRWHREGFVSDLLADQSGVSYNMVYYPWHAVEKVTVVEEE